MKKLDEDFIEKAKDLDIDLICICASKRIKIIDKNNFVLDNRKLILDYHFLTGDYTGLIKNLIWNKATLNEKQLEEYQRKDFIRVHGEFGRIIYSDVD